MAGERSPWSEEERQSLREWRAEGVPIRECAEKLGRTYGDVRARTRYLWSKPANPWSADELRRARNLRDMRFTFREIGERIGRSEYSVRNQLRRGEGYEHPQRLSPSERAELGAGINRDPEYVAACLAQGGFVTPKIIDGALVHIHPPGAFA